MTTNYDPIAEQYKRSKQQPWRTFIECFALMELMGGPQGMTVLDVSDDRSDVISSSIGIAAN